MNLTSRDIIKNLNERLFTQSAVIETLCELLIEKDVVTHDELESLIFNNIETRRGELEKLKKEFKPTRLKINVEKELSDSFDESLMEGFYFGPIGEA